MYLLVLNLTSRVGDGRCSLLRFTREEKGSITGAGKQSGAFADQHSDSGGLAPKSTVSNPNALRGRGSEDVVAGAHVSTSEVVKPLKSM